MRAEALRLGLLAALATALACERGASRALECSAPDRVQELSGVHYENVDCDAATESAESRLGAAFYRKACQQLAPASGLPGPVADASVESCRPAPEGGSILTIRVCCE